MSETNPRTFTITHCLGRGGFGEVYRASMSSAGGLEADVAVKVLRRDIDPTGQAVQRLRDEGRLLARLNHPTILKVHDLVILEGRIALVTEFVDGEDLTDCVVGQHSISPRALLEVIGQVASALAAAWDTPLEEGTGTLQLVHRDIKPSNIRIGRHGEVKLLDFGIARTDSVEREARTSTNMMVGSPPYMAPERFLDGIIRPGSDVFSLGAALFEGVVHERLHGDRPIPMLASLAVDRENYEGHIVDRLGLLPDDFPEEFSDLLCDMLAWIPEDRPTSADLAARCELLADAVKGKSLARWCRDRNWGEVTVERGELEGRTISEGSMARAVQFAPTAESPQPVESRGPMGLVIALAAILLLGTAGTTVFVGGLGGAWGIGLFDGSATDEVAPEPPPVAEDLPEEADEPAPEETLAAAPAPEPVAPPVAAAPSPRVVVTEVESPEPAAAPTRHVAQDGDSVVVVELRGAAGTFMLPADVPYGSYDIIAKYNGRDPTDAGLLEVVADGEYTVWCNGRMFRCEIR